MESGLNGEIERELRRTYDHINEWECSELLEEYNKLLELREKWLEKEYSDGYSHKVGEGNILIGMIAICLKMKGNCKGDDYLKIIKKFDEDEYKSVDLDLKFRMLDALQTSHITEILEYGEKSDIYETFKKLDPLWEEYRSYAKRWGLTPTSGGGHPSLYLALGNNHKGRMKKIRDGVIPYIEENPMAAMKLFKQLEKGIILAMESEKEREGLEEGMREIAENYAKKFEEEYDRIIKKIQESYMETISSLGEQEKSLVNSLKEEVTEGLKATEEELKEKFKELEDRKADLEERERNLEIILKKAKENERAAVELEIEKIRDTNEKLTNMLEEYKIYSKKISVEKKELENRVNRLSEALEKGDATDVISRSEAKKYELEWMEKLSKKLESSLPRSFYDPIRKDTFEIKGASEINISRSSQTDILKKYGITNIEIFPTNEGIEYEISKEKFLRETRKIRIKAIVNSHLDSIAEYGFDNIKSSISDLFRYLEPVLKKAKEEKAYTILAIASITGWDDEAIKSVDTSKNISRAFSSNYLSICLVDLPRGKIYYNHGDRNIEGYIKYFTVIDNEISYNENVNRCKRWIMDNIGTHDVYCKEIPLKIVQKKGGFSPRVSKEAIEHLENQKKISLRFVKDVGIICKLIEP